MTQFGGDWEFAQTFPSLAALNAVFPDGGAYSLETSGGSLGAFIEPMSFPTGSFPAIPFFTGTVFSDANGLNPNQDLNFSWNTPPGDVLFFAIIESATNNEVFFLDGFRNGNENDTSVVLPGGTFSANTDYEAILTFATGLDDTRTVFPSGSGLSARGRETNFAFTTGAAAAVPEPSTAILVSCLLLGMLVHRQRRRLIPRV